MNETTAEDYANQARNLAGFCAQYEHDLAEARAEIERLRAALEQIVRQDWWDDETKTGDEPDTVDGRCAEIARKALEGATQGESDNEWRSGDPEDHGAFDV